VRLYTVEQLYSVDTSPLLDVQICEVKIAFLKDMNSVMGALFNDVLV